MKSRLSFAGAAILTIAATVDAQERGVALGIGVSLNPAAIAGGNQVLLPVGLGNLYFPLIIGSSFKLEPEFGLLRLSEKTTAGTTSTESSATLTRLGIGAFWVTPIRESFRAYVGPRVGIVRNSESSRFGTQPESKVTQTNLVLELATGGEHLFSSHFSLGGEVRLGYINVGESKVTPTPPTPTPTPPPPVDRSESILTTNALILLRWYF